MSKKTPVFTPIDSGMKKDSPTPVKIKYEEEKKNNKSLVSKGTISELSNMLKKIDEDSEKEKEKKRNISSFQPIDFDKNEDSKNKDKNKRIKLEKPIAINKVDSDEEDYDTVLDAFEDEVDHINTYSNKEFEFFLDEITQFINMYDSQYRDNLLNLKQSEYVKIKNTLISVLEDLLEKNETNILIKNNEEEINDLLDTVMNDLFTEKSDIVKKKTEVKKKKLTKSETSGFTTIKKKGGMSNTKKTLKKKLELPKLTLTETPERFKQHNLPKPKEKINQKLEFPEIKVRSSSEIKKNRKMLEDDMIGGGLSKSSKKKALKKTRKSKHVLKKKSKTKKKMYIKELIRTENTEEPWKLYQKRIYENKINNWRNLIEKGTPTSPKETLYDCAYNALYFLDDINYDKAKVGCKKTNINKSGIELHEFMEEFKKMKNNRLKQKMEKSDKKINNYKHELKKMCIQDVVTSLKPGCGTYVLFTYETKYGSEGHVVIIARGINNKFFIIDPQRKIYEMDLFKYIYENKMESVYVIMEKSIVIEKKYKLI